MYFKIKRENKLFFLFTAVFENRKNEKNEEKKRKREQTSL
jgi:hypothetical protein